MSLYTQVGSCIWNSPLFRDRTFGARILYLALYTSPHAKHYPSGLWHGGLSVMAESAGMGAHDAYEALKELVDCNAVEWDQVTRVARLELVDRFERPANGKALKKWWNAFRTIPECAVRDRYVDTLRILIGSMTDDHQRWWDVTFGTVVVHSLSTASSASGDAQQTLFVEPKVDGMRYGIGYRTDEQCDDDVSPTSETVSDTVSDTHGVRVRVRRSGSQGVQGESSAGVTDDPQAPDQPNQDDDLEPERSPRVPPGPLPFSVADLVKTLAERSRGRFSAGFDQRLAKSLTGAIRSVQACGWNLPEVEVLGDWLGAGGLGFRSDLGPRWASTSGALVEAMAQAVRWASDGRPPITTRPVNGSNGARAAGRAEPAAAPVRGGRRTL